MSRAHQFRRPEPPEPPQAAADEVISFFDIIPTLASPTSLLASHAIAPFRAILAAMMANHAPFPAMLSPLLAAWDGLPMARTDAVKTAAPVKVAGQGNLGL